MLFKNFLPLFVCIVSTLAGSASFGLIAIHSGQRWQNAAIGIQDGRFHAGGTQYISFSVTDDCKLKIVKGLYVAIGSGYITLDSINGSTPWSIRGGFLNFQNSQYFKIADDGFVSWNDGGNNDTYALSAIDEKGQHIPDFSPCKNTSSCSSSTW